MWTERKVFLGRVGGMMFDCHVQEIAPLIIFIFHISRPRRKPDPDCRPDTASDCKDTPRAVKGMYTYKGFIVCRFVVSFAINGAWVSNQEISAIYSTDIWRVQAALSGQDKCVCTDAHLFDRNRKFRDWRDHTILHALQTSRAYGNSVRAGERCLETKFSCQTEELAHSI